MSAAYEYETRHPDYGNWFEMLNDYGARGWRLVATGMDRRGVDYFIFERAASGPVPGEAP